MYNFWTGLQNYKTNHWSNAVINIQAQLNTLFFPDTYVLGNDTICLRISLMLNKNTLGVKKSAEPISSSPTYVQPKALISAEAKKSPIKDISNYLNDIQ